MTEIGSPLPHFLWFWVLIWWPVFHVDYLTVDKSSEKAFVLCAMVHSPKRQGKLINTTFTSAVGTGANMKGKGNLGWTIHLAYPSAWVCWGALGVVVLPVSYLIPEMYNKYPVFSSSHFSLHIDLSLSQGLVSVKCTNISYGWSALCFQNQ